MEIGFCNLFYESNLQLDCSIAAIQKAVFSHFNPLCGCVQVSLFYFSLPLSFNFTVCIVCINSAYFGK